MNNLMTVSFGLPSHGWLPVEFRHQDFHLEFDASDVLNDPLDELYNAITKIQHNERRQITWWLEPGAYFFDMEKQGESITLTISQTANIHNEKAQKEVIHTINGNDVTVLKPLRLALKRFCCLTYDEGQWPYKFDKKRIEIL